MVKTGIEICLISARGLRRSSSLWKLHWFAVGWIDPKAKYCTNIDTSGSSNPSWRTKFGAIIDYDDDKSHEEGLALHVEVYSRDAIFLREKLQGKAVVLLKEFLANNNGGGEQVGSFQLRQKNSRRPHGFVDVSIRISHNSSSPYLGNGQGMQVRDEGNGIPLDEVGNGLYSSQPPPPSYPHRQMTTSGYNPQSSVGGPGYRPPPTPPPPPPPSHVGYIPTFLPNTGNYINIPSSSSSAPGRSGASNFGMGVGAGALAAGAVLFGDDFMSGFELPSTLQDDSLVISTDPLF